MELRLSQFRGFSVNWIRRIIYQVQTSKFLVQVKNLHFYCTTLSQAVTLRLVVPRIGSIDVLYLSVALYIKTSILNTLSFQKRP
jgi:hypothetical protein